MFIRALSQSYRYLLAHSEHLLSFINRVMYNKLVVVLFFIILRYTKNVKIHFAPLVFFFSLGFEFNQMRYSTKLLLIL